MKRLTFTFDNGPVPRATEAVLDFLAGRSIRATFFIVGQRLRDAETRKLAERAWTEGHWIGNHTLMHGAPLGMCFNREHAEREIGETQDLLGDLSHPLKFFRPNGNGTLGPHVLSRDALSYLIENRYTLVTWNNVPRDWEEPRSAWVGKAIAALANSSWSLLVLHDQHVAGMIDTLIEFYERVTQMGVEIVQDFPPSCVPIRQGIIVGPINDLVAPNARGAATMMEAPHA